MDIKPIQTYYNGYKFRSRLEARWAVFFDAAGVKYEYEPEGFVLPSGKTYLPDFLVHGFTERGPSDIWIEVKGTMTNEDAEKIKEFHLQGQPIIILDNIPNGNSAMDLWMNMCSHGFETMNGINVYPFNFGFVDGDFWSFGLMANGNGGLALCGADFSCYHGFDEALTVHAYDMARQARFEHGETPCV